MGSLPRLCRHCRLLLIRSPHLGALMTQSVVLLLCCPQFEGHLQAHSMFTPEEAFFSRVGAMSFASQGRQLPFPPLGHLEGQGNGTLPLSMVVMLINSPPPALLTLPGYRHSLKSFPSLQFLARKTIEVFCSLITFTFDFCDISESRFK